MKIRFALAGLLFAAIWCFAQTPVAPTGLHVVTNAPGFLTNVIVPLDRMPPSTLGATLPWRPGVPGGVPDYSYCNSVKDYGAAGDGVTDDYTAFANAIAACTNKGFVWVPAGTYKIGRTISIKYPKQIELRGGDPKTTILNSYATDGKAALDFSADSLGASYTSATGGYSRGSTAITMSSVSGFSVGMLAHVKQGFDGTIAPGPNEDTQFAIVNQLVKITNISGNTLQFDRPLYSDYRAGLNPVVGHFSSTTTRCGVRGLTINLLTQPSGDGFVVRMYNFDSCWVVNCVCSNAPHANISMIYGGRAEIRDSLVRNHQAYDSNARYGIQMASYACDCLVQNNISQGNNLSIVIQEGSVGNVVAYNFTDIGFGNGYPTGTDLMYGVACHGTFDCFNLIEGNVCPNIDSDQYWGSNQTNTYFRNWVTLKCIKSPDGSVIASGGYAVNMENYAYGHSIVGNVLSRFTNPRGGMYGNQGSGTSIDSTTSSTLFMHGNFDFVSNQAVWVTGVSQTLPPSYYLNSKPSWFGSLPWPAIGPDVNTSTSITNSPVIPAQARWMGVSY